MAGSLALALVVGLGGLAGVTSAQADVADAPIVSQQSLELTVTGSKGGTRTGIGSGREPIKVTRRQGGTVGVTGATEFSDASVAVDVSPLFGFLPVYFGSIRHDLGTGAVSTPVILGKVAAVPAGADEEAFRLSTTWFDFSTFPWASYTVELTVTSDLVSPATLCMSQVRQVEVALEAYNAHMGVYPGGAGDQVMLAGPVSEADADAMLARLSEDRSPDPAIGAQTAGIRLLRYAPSAAGRDPDVQVSVPAAGTDVPFVTLSIVPTGQSVEVEVEGWGVIQGAVVSCPELPGYESGGLTECQAAVRTVQVALEAYNAWMGTYPGGADDELPPTGPVSEENADAILGRLLADEDAQPGKPWTAKTKLLHDTPKAATLDHAGGSAQTSLPGGTTLEQFDGTFVALEYLSAGIPAAAEMNVYGYYTQYDGSVNRLESCQ